MSEPRTIERIRPDLTEVPISRVTGDHIVIVFNNDYNTWDEVIGILQKATGCCLAEAENETWEVHHLGRSLVHHGDRDECQRAAAVIRTIGIKVAVEQV